MKKLFFLISIVYLFSYCTNNNSNIKLVDASKFDTTIDDEKVSLYKLQNTEGTTCQITNFGGRVVSLWVKDKNEKYTDVVLGYDNIDDYQKAGAQYIGASIGRFANRIAEGKFNLNDSTFVLTKNNGDNHLHGGVKGLHNVVWDATLLSESELQLNYLLPDGEEGYPGNLFIELTYRLSDKNELQISYTATCDKDTPINLTHHSFFNLNGAGNGEITNHLLSVNADMYIPIKEGGLPTGEIHSVLNTPFDFTHLKAIGKQINDNNEQLKLGNGYDHCLVLKGSGIRFVAKVSSPKSGIYMDVITNEPGMQLYTGNYLNEKIHIGKNGKAYKKRTALCLETQHFPDSPNQSHFPSCILKAGKTYSSNCTYQFGVEE